MPRRHRFVKLPCWVRVLLTSQPQTESMFAAWDPKWIQPEDSQNQEDLLLLLRERLQQRKVVPSADLEEATELLLTKSGGQFIYSR